MINSVSVTGRLGKDPEVKNTDKGLTIAKFAVAVTEVRGKGEEKVETTHWIDCTAFGGVAEAVSKYVHKGDKVSVQGRLSQSKWEKEGKNFSKLEVIAENVEFMTGGNGKGKSTNGNTPATPSTDDDIPF